MCAHLRSECQAALIASTTSSFPLRYLTGHPFMEKSKWWLQCHMGHSASVMSASFLCGIHERREGAGEMCLCALSVPPLLQVSWLHQQGGDKQAARSQGWQLPGPKRTQPCWIIQPVFCVSLSLSSP